MMEVAQVVGGRPVAAVDEKSVNLPRRGLGGAGRCGYGQTEDGDESRPTHTGTTHPGAGARHQSSGRRAYLIVMLPSFTVAAGKSVRLADVSPAKFL